MPHSEHDERELVRELRRGTRSAFERLLDRSERRVYNLCLRLLGDAAEAEDAAQETFIEVHRALPGFRGSARLDTWIHRITVNVCLQRRRRKRVATVALLDGDLTAAAEGDPFDAALRGELREVVARAVQELPEGQREVVLLHGMQGLSYAETAEVLDCPVGTVKSRIAAAFRRLREILGSYVGIERNGAPVAAVGEGER